MKLELKEFEKTEEVKTFFVLFGKQHFWKFYRIDLMQFFLLLLPLRILMTFRNSGHARDIRPRGDINLSSSRNPPF
jgi:hypothetical protein